MHVAIYVSVSLKLVTEIIIFTKIMNILYI